MNDKIKAFANELLKEELEPGETIAIRELEPGIYCAYISTSRRGPGSFIIGEDLTFLFGSSRFSVLQLFEAYKNGERS